MRRSNNVGKDAAILTMAKMITMLITLLSNMLLSRFRTVEEYGTYSQLNIVVSLFVAFLMFGLPSSVNYFLALAHDSDERRRFLSNYYSLVTLLCLAIGLILVVTVPIIENYFNNPYLGTFSYFLFLYPWASVTISGISNVLVVYGRPKSLMVINVSAALVALFSVLIIQFMGMGFHAYMKAFLAGNMAISLFIYWLVYRIEGYLFFSINSTFLRKVFSYSVPIGLATLVGTINIEVDKLMIGNMMDTESLAYYANAGRELPLVFIAVSLTAVLLPQLVKELDENNKLGAVNIWKDSIELSYIFICFFTTLCVVFAPQIIAFLYSDKYLPGLSVFVVYSLILLWRTTYFGMVLNALGRTKLILWSSIVALIINVMLNVFFYYLFGFVGPAIASFVSIGVVDIGQLLFTCHILSIPFGNIFPWKRIFVISCVNLIVGILLYYNVLLLGLGTTIKDLLISLGIAVLSTLIYAVFMYKPSKQLWLKLNS